jgi:hypothetical protein
VVKNRRLRADSAVRFSRRIVAGIERRRRKLIDRRLRAARIRRGRLTWAIKISAPDDEGALRWGDSAFAQDLTDALSRMGQSVSIHPLGTHPPPPRGDYDVILVLRGLHRIDPVPGRLNYLWIISHPDAVSDDEARAGWTRIFAASRTWHPDAPWVAQPLLQAASARRFSPGAADEDAAEDVLFVGTSRGVVRPVVRDAIAVGARVGIYGHDWERFVDPSFIRADHLEFARVPAAYRSARVVLNDHWEDMRAHGFVSNRLFDAAFVGARVVSDDIDGLDELFGGVVKTYRSPAELKRLLTDESAWPSPQERLRIAAGIRKRHSFDARAHTLVQAALSDIRRPPRV